VVRQWQCRERSGRPGDLRDDGRVLSRARSLRGRNRGDADEARSDQLGVLHEVNFAELFSYVIPLPRVPSRRYLRYIS